MGFSNPDCPSAFRALRTADRLGFEKHDAVRIGSIKSLDTAEESTDGNLAGICYRNLIFAYIE